MPEVHRSTVSITFHGDDLCPEELTRQLGASPTKSHRKGEQKSSSSPDLIWSRGFWALDFSGELSEALDMQISHLLGCLTDDLQIWLNFTSRFEVRIFVGLFLHEWNEMTDISQQTLKLLADRGLRIAFDIYGQSDS